MFRTLLSCTIVLFLNVYAQAETYSDPKESSFWAQEVASGSMPPVTERMPLDPLVVDLKAKGRAYGEQGGTLRTLVSRSKDVRQMVVYGYARLVGYDHNYELYPDILRDYDPQLFSCYLLFI